ncbi:transposase [Piscirickettsia salmonis]|uniref:transposase n=1 Tax=Piscirickettsia salmonis TaxID=1238 RepID=UPI0011CE7625
MNSPLYPDNISDSEWTLIRKYLVNSKKLGGRPPKYGKRVMFDATLYLLRTGCSWSTYQKTFLPGSQCIHSIVVGLNVIFLRKRRYLGRYFAHPMMQNRRAKRDDYKPSGNPPLK